MAYKRLFAILLGMIMTVEAVPVVVFAKETDPVSDGLIVTEEEQADETEATEASVGETTVKKDKESPKSEDEKPAVSETEKKTEDKAPAETKSEDPAETEEKESAEKETDETEASDETTGEDNTQEPAETDADVPAEGSKEPAATDAKDPVDSNDQETPELKAGEIFIETGRPVETHVPGKKQDNDEQLETYFKKKTEEELGRGRSRPVLRKAAPTAGTRLSGNDKIAYEYFKSRISLVAKGSLTTAVFEIPISYFNLEKTTWTASELGVSSVLVYDSNGDAIGLNPKATEKVRGMVDIPFNLQAIDDALLADIPFELYWFDKTIGVRMFSYLLGAYYNDKTKKYDLGFAAGPTGCFWVSNDYAGIEYKDHGIVGNYNINSAKINRVNSAVTKAASVVKAAASKTDYQKLVYYCNQIRSFVEYDHNAVTNPEVKYGDPWQLISVFDGNSKTNVVCEGYSKAFMYLCNLTDFKDDISCITATGDIPAGGHMWNVVNMDDGKNYLVDITNIDGAGTQAAFNALFLAGSQTKVNNGYKFYNNSFVYDDECLRTYTSDQLEISDKNYYIARPVSVSAIDDKGDPMVSPASAKPDEVITIKPNPKTGYELDYIKVNDKTIGGTTYSMKGVPAVIEVYYKHKLYKVTVKASAGGSATVSSDSGYYGDSITVNAIPEKGYELDKITVNNGEPLTGNTFTMDLADANVSVTFKKIPFKVTVNSGEHGTASADLNEACVGDTVRLNVLPEKGYFAKSITVNGEPVTGNTFKMLPEPVTVEVGFDLIAQAAIGDILTDGVNNYRITNNAMSGAGTVAFIGSANNAAYVSIPAVITLKGIPYKVTKIASYAFNRNPHVTSVYIGGNVSVIESRAFVGCAKLAKISGGAKLKTIGSRAFISCAKLKSFSISSSVLSKIGSYAFSGDKSLKTLNIKKTTKLKKKSVKKSLKGSKIKTVKVKKSKVRKYKRYFTKKNCGRRVKVKK